MLGAATGHVAVHIVAGAGGTVAALGDLRRRRQPLAVASRSRAGCGRAASCTLRFAECCMQTSHDTPSMDLSEEGPTP
jgi:hypothetical protein